MAPALVLAGAPVTVNWTVTNAGESATSGPWVDQVYFSASGQLTGATLLGSLNRTAVLGAGESYQASLQVTLPQLADTDSARLFVVTDAAAQVYELLRESDNTADASIALRHVDLRADAIVAPTSAQSGDAISVSFEVDFFKIEPGTINYVGDLVVQWEAEKEGISIHAYSLIVDRENETIAEAKRDYTWLFEKYPYRRAIK